MCGSWSAGFFSLCFGQSVSSMGSDGKVSKTIKIKFCADTRSPVRMKLTDIWCSLGFLSSVTSRPNFSLVQHLLDGLAPNILETFLLFSPRG